MNPPPRRTGHADKGAVAPLSFEDWQTQPRCRSEIRLPAVGAVGSNARLWVRPRLTKARWPGSTDIAARVADKLVDNAVRHGRAFPDGCVVLRLAVLHSERRRPASARMPPGRGRTAGARHQEEPRDGRTGRRSRPAVPVAVNDRQWPSAAHLP
ncbi:hypothetical protein ACJ6WE_38945 [Streptomyces sp. MMS24-I31]|uniref:hypothetical protein n=1 Tax=Streptomyces sp. MMS24-I31 TaxID=3351563 RepID=UPI003896A140